MGKQKMNFEDWLYENGYFHCSNIGYVDTGYIFHGKKQLSQKYKEYLKEP